jgi:polyhydroxybutyrate depolymerase
MRAALVWTGRWNVAALVTLGALVVPGACKSPTAPGRNDVDGLVGPLDATFALPGHPGRDWLLHLPPGYDGRDAIPLVVGFHGGGGKKEGLNRTTCADGDESADNCLFAVADREGFATVFPDGVDRPGPGGRSFHAGGGEDGFRCVGGQACADDVDDVAFVDDLLAEVARVVEVDATRVFATGISNGGAMSHRLACDRADVFAAIAAVGGANQAQTSPGCTPSRPIPVLQIHGTGDPCWGFDGSTVEPLCADPDGDGAFVDVPSSMQGWRARNGCDGTTDTALPDVVDDGTASTRIDGTGCDADTTLIRIDNGGHTWPGGWQYLGVDRIGPVSRDLHGSDVVWQFFAAHPRR